MFDLTTRVAVKVHQGVALNITLDGISQLVLLHLSVEGTVGPIG